jgi:hypothetical protein
VTDKLPPGGFTECSYESKVPVPCLWESSNALEGNYVKRKRALASLTIATALGFATTAFVSKISADNDKSDHFRFQPDSLVLSRSVYVGTASTIKIGETLPLGCPGGPNGSTVVKVPTTTNGVTDVTVTCGVATDNGEFPNLSDS